MTDRADDKHELEAQGLNEFAPADESAEVDLCLIDTLLAMTPAERLRWHAEWMEFADQQRRLRANEYGFDPADLRVAEEAE